MGNRMPRCGVYWKCQSDREGRYGAENPEGNRVWYSKYGRRSGRYACDDTFDTADEFFEHRCARGYPEDWSEIVELDCMPEQYGQAGKYWKVPDHPEFPDLVRWSKSKCHLRSDVEFECPDEYTRLQPASTLPLMLNARI